MQGATSNLNKLILVILSIGYLILPFFEIKIILLGTFLFLALNFLKNGITIRKTNLIFVLVLLYALNFLVVPYWSLKPGIPHVATSSLILVVGLLLFMSACYTSTSDLEFPRFNERVYLYFGVLFIGAVVLNYLPMINSIGYRGDDDYHIRVTMGFFLYFTNNISYLFIFLFLVLITYRYAVAKNDTILFLIPVYAVIFCIVTHLLYPAVFPAWIKRYPSIFHLTNAAFSIPMTSFFAQEYLFIESNYRILIMAATVILAVYAITRIDSVNGLLKVLIGLYILTIPALHYYASLVYIDMLMILFAFVAMFNFEHNVQSFYENKSINQTLFFIVLLAFIKETSIVYLLVFWLFAVYILYYRTDHDIRGNIYILGKYTAITLIPLVVFLYFRDVPHNPYNLALNNLFVLGNYKVLIVSLWEQFGFLLPVTIGSIIYLIIKKKYFLVVFHLCLIAGYVAFYMLNGKIDTTFMNNDLHYTGTTYFGHSRFNLALIPSFLTLMISSINLLKRKYEKIVVLVFVFLIVSNQILTPINFIKGLRKPGWGDYTVWTSEYDYPYDDAYRWISNHLEIKDVGIVGRTFPYFDHFYHQKYNLRFNRFRVVGTKNRVKNTELDNLNYLLYHKEPAFYKAPDPLTLNNLSRYRKLKEFAKGELSLSLYMKKNN